MFGRKRSLHVCLESTKDKGFENFVELRNELILFVVILNIEIEPFIKLFRAFKDLQRHMARKLVENRIESIRKIRGTAKAIVYVHQGRESLIVPRVHAGKNKRTPQLVRNLGEAVTRR
jgi:hypothetical protein